MMIISSQICTLSCARHQCRKSTINICFVYASGLFTWYQITSDCELLLVKKRLDESRFSRYGAAASRDKMLSKPPDLSRIREATAKLPRKGTVQKQRDTVSAEAVSRYSTPQIYSPESS